MTALSRRLNIIVIPRTSPIYSLCKKFIPAHQFDVQYLESEADLKSQPWQPSTRLVIIDRQNGANEELSTRRLLRSFLVGNSGVSYWQIGSEPDSELPPSAYAFTDSYSPVNIDDESAEIPAFFQSAMNQFHLKLENAQKNMMDSSLHLYARYDSALRTVSSLLAQESSMKLGELTVIPGNYSHRNDGLFDVAKYFSLLPKQVTFGSNLLYGHRITSTQSLLLNSSSILHQLPHGFTFLTDQQTEGRGRYGNGWISPPGCLLFSTVLHVTDSKLMIMLQFLVSIAITKILRNKHDIPAYIKWPNDIYTKTNDGQLLKVGGILVSTSFLKPWGFSAIVGCGLNVCNHLPTVSLQQFSQSEIQCESVLADILTEFESMFNEYVYSGFEPFIQQYQDLWLHQNQHVRVQQSSELKSSTVNAQITGISREGYLLARDLDSNAVLELHPDGNRFDLMQSLLIARSSL